MQRPARAAVALLMLAAALACHGDDGSGEPAAGETAHDPHAAHRAAASDATHREEHDHGADPPPDAPTEGSIYVLESTWTDQHGDAMALRALSGRVVVLAMVYTHCEAACPRIIADIRRVRAALGDASDGLAYVLVSIDPERDTTARLQTFATETGLEDWTLLRGDDADVRELAAVLGVRFKRVSDTDFVHSNLLTVLDREGRVAHRQIGLGIDPADTVEVIRGLE